MDEDLYGIRKRWKMKPTTYQGDTPIETEDGLYVCVVPYQVAYGIVRDHNATLADERRLAGLIDAGMRLAGQVDTFAIQFHQRERHPEPFSECGNGTCRSSLKHALAWEIAAGDEGHNWIAEQGRRG